MIRAVLIDDEISNLENLQNLLEKHCPQVSIIATAQNVSDAVDTIQKYLPDLVFLDIQMGGYFGETMPVISVKPCHSKRSYNYI